MRWQRLIDGLHELANRLDRFLLAPPDLLEHLLGQLGGSLNGVAAGCILGLFGCGGHFRLLVVAGPAPRDDPMQLSSSQIYDAFLAHFIGENPRFD